MAGDLVGEDDISSSPTFELIVEGEEAEEVELESRCTTAALTASDTSAATMTTVAKQLTMSDTVNIASLSDCITASGFGTGSKLYDFCQVYTSQNFNIFLFFLVIILILFCVTYHHPSFQ